MSELDLLRFPLSGRQLIEASAGTGKTYSITALHLRALLGHGVPAPVAVDRLLVVTFTNAATDELRGRVRSRLVQMRAQLHTGQPGVDKFNNALAAQIAAHDVPRAISTLDVALHSLDTAAIYTIHAFCLRVLREFAFDSGVAFEQEFITDERDYLRTAVTDAWRRLVYGGASAADTGARLYALWPSPDRLWRDVEDLLRRSDVELRGATLDTVVAASEMLTQAIVAFKTVAIDLHLADALQASNLSTDATHGLAAPVRVAALRALLTLPGSQGSGHDGEALVHFIARYTSAAFAAAKRLKKPGRPFDEAAVGAAADCVEQMGRLLRACALRDVLMAARVDAAREKERRGVLSADDVLARTSAALSGADGAAFARKLRQRYPVAMIDEFQDTDSVQWQIFDRIYGAAAASATDTAACVLIGDPKQAIYGFRGADIFSYLDARAAIGDDCIHRLIVTHRASPPLAGALNALYANAQAQPFLLAGIDYVPVESALTRANTGFSSAATEAPPLVFWHLDLQGKTSVAKGALVTAMANIAAARIDGLLRDGWRVDGKALAPGDIAILVRNRDEADPMRRALARLDRATAFLNRGSVFAGQCAGLVRLLLSAVLDPNDDTRVRAVLASRIGDWSVAQLARSLLDDGAWEVETERVHALAAIATERGVLAMLRAAVAQFGLAQRWLALPDGARLLTDLRHIGELLQSEAARLGGGARLLRWLEQRIAAAQQEGDDEHLMRLESDADLIKIVTLHGAKGLEYPVVVLPFVCSVRVSAKGIYHELNVAAGAPAAGSAATSDQTADRRPEQRYRAVRDLGDGVHPQIDHERIAEDLRLLYVGLTRARRACFVGVANCVSNGEPLTAGAFGRLLLGDDPAAGDGALGAALARLARTCPDIAIETVADGPTRRVEAAPTASVLPALSVRPFTGRIDSSWKISSYSSLTRAANAEYTAPGADDEDAGDHAVPTESDAAIQYQFPRGAGAGVLLHKLFERWPEGDPLAFVADQLRGAALAGSNVRGGDTRAAEVAAWITRIRAEPLAPLRVALRDLRHVRVEMEFQLPLAREPTAQLWRVLADHGYRGDALPAQQLNGLLKGFIDLVFEHEGQYFIVDYKSNFLGGQAAAYAQEHLTAAMRSHRYDLQFLLYALALRRWLAVHNRPGVTPAVLYLFLRGIAAPGAGIYHHVPSPAVLDALDELFGRPPAASAMTGVQ